ncbi:hypothetical protein H6P81_012134 [Aristolochia fimbriata]|uniref:ELMO domain-containing protein n=1 Tax=Aristolochia fimbriata TaxID=158543 RepID=A0AAV7EDR8_ARIFI|nr:hypothetical protein H6P81_012134 [Aristolochia fimbriata]
MGIIVTLSIQTPLLADMGEAANKTTKLLFYFFQLILFYRPDLRLSRRAEAVLPTARPPFTRGIEPFREMSVDRTQGTSVGIRTLSTSSSFSRCAYASSASEHARCGTPAWMGRGLSCVCIKTKGTYERICVNLTPLQEERVQRLRHRMKVYFDSSRPDHQEALRALWYATYPDQELHGLISDQWKQMGWQGRDPSTDFRGAGFISLENLLFFAKTFSVSFQQLLNKKGGKRATWEYPFAVAGVNITFMIMQMLDLHSIKPRTFVRTVFIQMLSENEWAFDLLYCVAFMVMDKQWLAKNASYMEFNDILKSTRAQLEKELLMDDVLRIEDMPSYSLLH